LLRDAISDVLAQTIPVTLVVSVPDDGSLPPEGVPDGALLVYDRGLTAQRNAGLAAVPEADFVFFFDDDAVVRPDFVERGLDFFERHPEVAGITGEVLLDGASGDEVSRSDAEAALVSSASAGLRRQFRYSRELYGCNFAYRRSAAPMEFFDARLPLYSWLEDHDFARRLMRHGRLAKVADCVIVHRGVKSGGRVAHTRLGYSQMMNPFYLHHVGSFPLWLTMHETVFRCGKNLVYAVAGGEASWRRERVKGNIIALFDVVRGRFTPERMLEF
jgi:GT2 family glycosyltransferase